MQVGKRRFVFGLKWVQADVPVKELVREQVESGHGYSHYAEVRNAAKTTVVGFHEGDAAEKRPIYSAAAAIAAMKQDGVYLAALDHVIDDVPRAWYVVVANGLVLTDTDVIQPIGDAKFSVEGLSTSLGLPVFVAGDIDVESATPFELEGVLRAAKVPALKKIGGAASNAVGAVLLVLVALAIGYGIWHFAIRKPPAVMDTSAAEAEMLRQTYLDGMRAHMTPYTFNGDWVRVAYRTATGVFPPVIDGWRQDGVTCTPQSCVANYSIGQDSPYVLSSVIRRFGAGAVQVLDDKRSLTITSPLQGVEIQQWDDLLLLQLPPTEARAVDAAGMLGLRFAGVDLDGPPEVMDLYAQNPAPPDAGPAYRDLISTKYDSSLNETLLRGLARHFASYGFSATSVAYSNGIGGAPEAWRAQWVRFHGGEQ